MEQDSVKYFGVTVDKYISWKPRALLMYEEQAWEKLLLSGGLASIFLGKSGKCFYLPFVISI